MNSHYHIISNAAGTKETGMEYPQVKSMTKGYDLNAANSVWALHEVRNNKPKFKPNLDGFVLYKKAGLTDAISAGYIGGRGLLVSDRFKKLLQKFNLTNHIFYPATVIKDDKTHKYFWMHLVDSDFRKNVVFSKTKFSNWPKLKLKDYKDYLRFDKEEDEFGLLRAGFVTLDRKFDKTLDLFMISAFDQNLYASQNLINTIKENKITGVEIVDSLKNLTFEK
jgi:hypothetical protein